MSDEMVLTDTHPNPQDLDMLMHSRRVGEEGPETEHAPETAPAESPDTPNSWEQEQETGETAPAELPDTPEPRQTEPAETAPEDPDTPPKYRFKNHEEAEASYREAQAYATRLAQERSRLQKELETERAAREKLVHQQAEAERAEQVNRELNAYAEEQYAKVQTDLGSLDPEDEGYGTEYGKLFARANAAIRAKERELVSGQQTGTKATNAGAEPAPEPGDESSPVPGPDPGTVERVQSMITKAGIDLADGAFQQMAASVPRTDDDGNPIPLEDQAWTAIRQYWELQRTGAAQKARQQSTAPLSRTGATGPKSPGQVQPMSMEDAIQSATERRRIQ